MNQWTSSTGLLLFIIFCYIYFSSFRCIFSFFSFFSFIDKSNLFKDTSCFGANRDDFGNVFAEGTSYLAGHFLEKNSETEMKQTFQLTSKTAYF